jgi:hypothetical protein
MLEQSWDDEDVLALSDEERLKVYSRPSNKEVPLRKENCGNDIGFNHRKAILDADDRGRESLSSSPSKREKLECGAVFVYAFDSPLQ